MPNELHHRSHEKLNGYWKAISNGRPFPPENEINPDELADIWDSCFLVAVDVVAKRSGYRYSFLGERLIEAYGDDVRNPEVATQLISTANPSTAKKIDEVIQSQKPVVDEAEFVNSKGISIRYRSCLLPLGQAGKVTHVIGCMRWKLY